MKKSSKLNDDFYTYLANKFLFIIMHIGVFLSHNIKKTIYFFKYCNSKKNRAEKGRTVI